MYTCLYVCITLTQNEENPQQLKSTIRVEAEQNENIRVCYLHTLQACLYCPPTTAKSKKQVNATSSMYSKIVNKFIVFHQIAERAFIRIMNTTITTITK